MFKAQTKSSHFWPDQMKSHIDLDLVFLALTLAKYKYMDNPKMELLLKIVVVLFSCEVSKDRFLLFL